MSIFWKLCEPILTGSINLNLKWKELRQAGAEMCQAHIDCVREGSVHMRDFSCFNKWWVTQLHFDWPTAHSQLCHSFWSQCDSSYPSLIRTTPSLKQSVDVEVKFSVVSIDWQTTAHSQCNGLDSGSTLDFTIPQLIRRAAFFPLNITDNSWQLETQTTLFCHTGWTGKQVQMISRKTFFPSGWLYSWPTLGFTPHQSILYPRVWIFDAQDLSVQVCLENKSWAYF